MYYSGTSAQWDEIIIGSNNDYLTSATIHYNSAGPTSMGNEPEDRLAPAEDLMPDLPEESTDPEPVNDPAAEPENDPEPITDPEPVNEPAAEPENDPEPITDLEPIDEPAAEPVSDPAAIPDSEPDFNANTDPGTMEGSGSVEDPDVNQDEYVFEPLAMYLPAEDNGTLARFSGLLPGAPYVFLVTTGDEEPASLNAEDLLYIAQFNADAAGTLTINYVPRVNAAGACARVYGASHKSLTNAAITVEQFVGGRYRVCVVYDGVELTEEQDYLLSIEDEKDVVTVTVRGRGDYSGMQTVAGDKYPDEAVPVIIELTQEYVVLPVGESTSIQAAVTPKVYAPLLTWSVEGDSSVASVTADGTVTALREGSAWISAELIVDGTTYAARCRVDVVEGEGEHPIADDVAAEANGVSGVRLTSTKATTELFHTEYTRIQVIPELTQNNKKRAAVTPTPEPAADAGVAIEGAEFTDDETKSLFALRVADDRTLEVIPTRAAMESHASLKSSYTSTIAVTVDGRVFETAALTLTVKKTEPKITAKKIAFNSYYTDIQKVTFTGGNVESVEPDPNKPLPPWLMWDMLSNRLIYIGDQGAKKSGKVYLLVTAEGWAVRRNVTVEVSAKSTAPKMTFKPGTLTLKPGTSDSATTAWTLKPASFAGQEVTVSRITEGKKTYANGEVLNVVLTGSGAVVTAPYVDGKAHTYKVVLSVLGKESSFTVKTLADSKAVALTLKAKGTMDLAIPESPVTITAAMKNYHTGEAALSLTSVRLSGGTEDVSGRFNIRQSGNVFTLTAIDAEPGKYTATVSADYGGPAPAAKTVTFTVKRSATTPAVSVTLKAAGKIDVLRPGTKVTLTPTVKNSYTHTLTPEDLTILRTYDGAAKKKVSEDVTDRFDISVEGGKYVISPASGSGVSHADKFSVRASVAGATSKAVTLKVVQGKAKVSQSVKTVTLLKTDRYSRGEVVLTLPDGTLAGIAEVVLVSPKDKQGLPLFELKDLGNGRYAIAYYGDKITTTKAATVKLQVRLLGNETAKPNATLSVKVTFK